MRVKATFFLPVKDNDGRDLSSEIVQVERECFAAFGAWTHAGYFTGAWKMQTGDRKMDVSAAYWIVLDEECIPELEGILWRFKSRTTQESIYLEIEHNVDMRLI
ncbi:MAG: hypothetical protein AB1714_16695 [Acidobacteriota bacterium]